MRRLTLFAWFHCSSSLAGVAEFGFLVVRAKATPCISSSVPTCSYQRRKCWPTKTLNFDMSQSGLAKVAFDIAEVCIEVRVIASRFMSLAMINPLDCWKQCWRSWIMLSSRGMREHCPKGFIYGIPLKSPRIQQ